MILTDSQASSPNDDGGEPSGSNIGSESDSDDTIKEQSSDNDQESMQIGEEDFSKGNMFENYDVPTNLFNTNESNIRESSLRRSSRQSKLPPKLNDDVLNSKVRSGLDKFANHTWLFVENCGFIANINMSFKPKSYEEDALDKNWVQAMNEEMEALHENNSWDLVELPKNRKAIGSKCLISLAVQNGWCLFQLDVNNAFLYGNLDKDVYMLPPPGYFNKNETKNGHDHSLYTKEYGGNFVALLVYVDDIMLTGNNINDATSKKYLFKMKYCLELLHNYGLLACKLVSTPLPKNMILAHKESEDDKFLKNITSYQRLIGKLIYLTLTRPDISYSVHSLSQHMQAPLQYHMDLGLRVLRYLKGTPGSGVNYEKSEHMSLKVYADSDWAKCPVTRRSVSGYCVFFNGCMVS
ncbi:ribonuclease H-like domain-containing protein [Tanacetum coccineum]